MRHKTNRIKIGNIAIGGDEPIAIQSMLSCPPTDIDANIRQAKNLESAGCEILRVAIPDKGSVQLVEILKNNVSMPIVADIHFDYRLALDCAAAGVDKIRINPGNIGSDEKVKAVADICRLKNIPIRIGVNSGSVEKHILAKYGRPTPQALVESALYHASLLEKFDFENIAISMKSVDVPSMLEAYRIAADSCVYPLHLGVTHTGVARMGLVKSAMGIGGLLLEGIGDTLRVSLAADPVEEIRAAKDILLASGISRKWPEIIACPTCGRAGIDVIDLANKVDLALKDCTVPVVVAVMGCVVNGPGEAREADLGIAGGNGTGILFAKGKVVKKVPQEEILSTLLEEISKFEKENAAV